MKNKMRRFDVHVHSRYSDGINSPQELVNEARKMGLAGIAITDHNEIKGTLAAMKFQGDGFSVIPGTEVSAKEGHIIALGVQKTITENRPAEETIRRIHDLGGIAIAAHPYDVFRGGVGDLSYQLDFDAIEVENGHSLRNYKNPLAVAKERNLAISGGSDAHCLEELGSVVIAVPDGYDPLEAIKNHQVEIISRISKIRILRNFVSRRCKKAVGRFF